MKKFLRFILILIITSIMFTAHLPIIVLAENLQSQINNKATFKDGEVIIMYKKNTTDNGIKAKSLINPSKFLDGLTVENTVTFEDAEENNNNLLTTNSVLQSDKTTDYVVSLVKSDKYSTNELINKLSKENSIMYVQKNYKVKATGITNDTYQKYQWAIENIGQNGGMQGLDINPEKVTTESSDEKVVAIVDSGVDYTHSELKNHMWNNPYASKKALLGKHGYDFVNKDEEPIDENGHGTHVAGIIAAESNNNEGITGAILNKSNIKIMALRFLDEEGYGDIYGAISAYNYIYKAQKLGTNIIAINNSWGGGADDSDNIFKNIIDLVGKGPNSDGKGALSICASGNNGLNTDNMFNVPSCINSDYIISVGASNEKDNLAEFSNYGINTVDIAAPGTNILSTVSYNCFNPSIYDNKEELCDKYESFDSETLGIKYKVTEGTVTTTSDNYFGNSGKSLNWSFNAIKGKQYYLLIPYEITKNKQHISEMVKATTKKDNEYELYVYNDERNYEDITINNNLSLEELAKNKNIKKLSAQDGTYWTHIETIAANSGTLVLTYTAGADSKVTINIDDFAISKSTVSEDSFGKYDFYNGTSMATPFVTSATAISANYNADETAIQRKERILGTTRKSDSLKGKVLTGGVLDLTYLKNPNIIIKSAKINLDGELTIGVRNMKKMPKVFINNSEVTATKVNSTTLKVVNKSLINRTVKITLQINDNNVDSKTVFLLAGNSFNKEKNTFIVSDISKAFTNGKDIYVYSDFYREVYRIIKEEGFGYTYEEVVELSEKSIKQLLGDQSKFMNTFEGINYNVENTDLVFINNRIYTIFTFDYGYGVDKVLAYYDINKDDQIWRKATLPKGCSNLSMPTLASYNGNLYVIGGYNIVNNKISQKVYEFNTSAKKWSVIKDLPEGRFAAKANQVGNKLLLSFGGKDDGKVPNLLIFDGKNWKETKATINLKKYTGIYNNKKYYNLGTGIISGGLAFSGISAEKFGNTFYYDIATDTYKKSNYKVNTNLFIDGVSIGNKYYVFEADDPEFVSEIKMYSIPVKSGLSKLTVTYPTTGIKATINAKLYSRKTVDNRLTNIYYYMPGSTMNFNLSDQAGYCIKNFKVDGKEVNGYKYSNVIGADRTIQLTTTKNTNLIKLNKTSANLSSFSTLKLTATLSDKSATTVKWATNNKNYATISSKGVITPKWAGNGKTVTITASSTIRGRKASVTSKINIKAPTINNLKAKTTKNSITLNWSAVSGADGYEVYAYNETSKKYVLYKKPKTNSVTGINLRAGTTYRFQVLAYKTIDKKKCVTARSTITCATLKNN